MDITQALDQAATEVESTATAAGGDSGSDIETTKDSTQGGSGSSSLGVDGVPAELADKEKELLRAFHTKTQALAEKERQIREESNQYKQDAQAFYELSKQNWFKQAVEAEKALRSGAPAEIPDEALTDKRVLQEFLQKRDEAMMNRVKAQLAPELQKLGKSQADLLAERELSAAVTKYGDDFAKAKDDGSLAPYLKEYDPETAYKLFCQDNGRVAGVRKESGRSEDRKATVVEKSGMGKARGGPVVKAANLSEALDRAFDLARRGVKDYNFERPR